MDAKHHKHKKSRSPAGSRRQHRPRRSPGWSGSKGHRPSRTPGGVFPEYLTIRQLSDYSGIGVRKLRDLLKEGLPYHRVGVRIIRVKKSDFDEWIEQYRTSEDQVGALVEDLVRKVTS